MSYILLSTLFSNTLSQCSSLTVGDQVSCQYKTSGKIIVLYVLMFTFLDRRQEDKTFLSGLNFFTNELFVTVIQKYFNFVIY